MKMIRRLSCAVLTLAMALTLPFAASAEMMKVKKVDNFVIFVDQSGSMAEPVAKTDKKKIAAALDAIARLDKVIPDLGYIGGMSLFAPYAAVSPPAPYKPGALTAAAAGVKTDFSVFGRETPMGDGLETIDPVLGGLQGKTALIIYTDGDSNRGSDPVAAAKALYSKYAPNLCIHVVSFADNPHGKLVIDQIRALSGCTVVADVNSLATDAAMAQYARDVLYSEAAAPAMAPAPAPAPVPVPAPAPAPAPAPVAKEIITFNLLFDFDKADIKDDMIPALEQAKAILNEDPRATFIVAGHADATGAEAYNQGLSERRAAAVKGWLVANGIEASRLETVGYGETQPKYDNTTEEGRRLNRRVEMQTK